MVASSIQKTKAPHSRNDLRFYYGMGTLQFIEALQNGYIDLSTDYVHQYPDQNSNTLFLTPDVPGGLDHAATTAHINSMHSHGRALFGFDFDFSKTDYLIQIIHEYNCQPQRPRYIRRTLYEFKKLCMLNGIPKEKILPYLQMIRLTFRGFILEFNQSILHKLKIFTEADLYDSMEYRFVFQSNRIPFQSVVSYTGLGVIEEKFTRRYFALLDHYQKQKQSLSPDQTDARKRILNEFYIQQARLIREVKSNIHKPYMIKFIEE